MAVSIGEVETRARFQRDRFTKITSLIESALAAMLYEYVKLRSNGVQGTSSSLAGLSNVAEGSADPLMEHILSGITPRIEVLTGLSLCPTYSFFRLYRRTSRLPPHRDRESCEVSVSLHLGQSGDRPWPLWIKGPSGQSGVDLLPGDALLYYGIECKHWRNELMATEYAQLFLHYVDKHGPFRHHRFDGRASLNIG